MEEVVRGEEIRAVEGGVRDYFVSRTVKGRRENIFYMWSGVFEVAESRSERIF